MAYTQITAMYTGFTGGPGWVRMRWGGVLDVSAANAAAANWKTFLNSIPTLYPNGSSISFLSGFQTFNDAGELSGEDSLSTVPTVINGTAVAAYAGGAGAVIQWLTASFISGRRVRGRTFLVPLGSVAFQSDGTLAATTVTTLQTAALAFAGSTPVPCVVSKRELAGVKSALASAMTGAQIPDRSAILRSRRD